MRLKQIEIVGFKSFADKVVFLLADGITAIVGPNGSGKSNVADAVRWVLGEQSARALRGSKMEDVIFSGSQNRKATSLCEVSLTFDNGDRSLACDEAEVMVSRRLYRNGESEYLLNGKRVKLREVQGLFYDTGVGREGYSIIGQGRIDEILSTKGEERREALEEAAGVMKFKIRREEARRKLSAVGNDIVRIDDILSELGISLEPLRVQSAAALRATTLREALKQAEVTLFLQQYDRNRQRVGQVQTQIQQADQDELSHRHQQQTAQGDLELLTDKLQLTEELLARAREKMMDQMGSRQQTQGRIELLEQQQAFLVQEGQRLIELAAALDAQQGEVDQWLSAQCEATPEQIQALEAQEGTLAADHESLQQEVLLQEDELDHSKQTLMTLVSSDSERKARLARVEALQAQVEERKAEMATRLSQAHEQVNQLAQELIQSNAQSEQAQQAMRQAQAHHQQLGEARTKEQGLLEGARRAHQQAQANQQRSEAALRTQRQLQRDYEGYANSVRLLMRDLGQQQVSNDGVLGTVATLMSAPANLEVAMEQVLGGALQNVVVEDQPTAKRLIEYLRAKQYGRVTFLPQASLTVRTFSQSERQQLNGPGVLGIASELIDCQPAAQRAIQHLLGRTMVVESIDAGIALTRKCTFSYRVVTLKGDILQAGGAMTGGSVKEFSLIARERLVNQAQQAVDETNRALQAAEQALEQAQSDAQRSEQAHQQAYEKLIALQGETHIARERSEATAEAAQRAQAQLDQLQLEIARIEAMGSDAQEEIERIRTTSPQDEQALRATIETQTQRYARLRAQAEQSGTALTALREQLTAARSEMRAFAAQQARAEQELTRLNAARETNGRERAENERQSEALRTQIAEVRAQYERILKGTTDNQGALEAVSAQHDHLRAQQQTLLEAVQAHREAVSECRENKLKLEAQLERLSADFDYLQTRLWDDYELTYATAQTLYEDVTPLATARDVPRLKEELKEMGAINLGAIEEYERVNTRYEFLTTQRADLAKAQGDLNELIDGLTEQMRAQFLVQFDIINQHFGRIFTMLFKGGEAHLSLSDPRDVMECAIDIIAQPPGKTLKPLTLLSGGERSLTAIALLFALLEVRATPFCVLDEIEAALDEENQRLFADFLKAYAQRTQFIVITHRRPTMEAAESLYGIAMKEAGVSQTVSVKFA